MIHCAVPENIHTPPTEGIGNFWGVGGSMRPKNLKTCMKLNWNFQTGRGQVGGAGYFLELHIESIFSFHYSLTNSLNPVPFNA